MWRDHDPREDERERSELSRGSRGGVTPDEQSPTIDPRDVFTRDLELPRGRARERVRARDGNYELHGSEARTLATVGAFRVVPAADLPDPADRRAPRTRDLARLRDLGLVRTMRYVVDRTRTRLVTLTERGRGVLEDTRRERNGEPRQAFYVGVSKPRELAHDVRLYSAYLKSADRLVDRGARVRRVVLEEELKREYQRFLQGSNRGRRESSGRPDRRSDEVEQWAREHALPVIDGHVQFPDVRIEYDERDGRRAVEDVEVTTPHYRGAHAAAKALAGFSRYRATGARLGGASGSRRGGRGLDPRLAEEMLQ
jgi:hypothetical protein